QRRRSKGPFSREPEATACRRYSRLNGQRNRTPILLQCCTKVLSSVLATLYYVLGTPCPPSRHPPLPDSPLSPRPEQRRLCARARPQVVLSREFRRQCSCTALLSSWSGQAGFG